ncbi:coiled coil protein [Actinidia rufa]|uniref:Coiled coil protein n=1 Tax=Actinidia rufa TaxID=165716 RepID=A0A7J0GMN3_9ERIC|nr:coiled coil protein [Actinidia rufa]
MDNHQSRVCNGDKCSANGYLSNGGASLQNLTQISVIVQQETKGNVHSGAPPPWLDATEGNILNVRPKPDLGASSLNKSGKSQNLNPKRVGAAWAEKRKWELELELEKRGEIVPNNFDANWLPNFGRVWQSGSRKESRKEFVVENKNSLTGETQSETLNDIQPYVSKRMCVVNQLASVDMLDKSLILLKWGRSYNTRDFVLFASQRRLVGRPWKGLMNGVSKANMFPSLIAANRCG